jgi:hypothetical protein
MAEEEEAALALEVYARNADEEDDDDDLVYNDAPHGSNSSSSDGGAAAISAMAAAAASSPSLEDNDREEEISQQNNHAAAAAGGGSEPPERAAAGPDEEEEDDDDAEAAGNYTNKWHQNGYGHVVPKQSGKFSREESDIIKTAIEEYCQRKNITVKALCSEREHKADLKGAWMEIAKKLPERSVQSVYRHGIRQCHPFKRGAWSEAEVSMLQDLVAHNSKKWSMIQTKLNRSADSCRDKVNVKNVYCL